MMTSHFFLAPSVWRDLGRFWESESRLLHRDDRLRSVATRATRRVAVPSARGPTLRWSSPPGLMCYDDVLGLAKATCRQRWMGNGNGWVEGKGLQRSGPGKGSTVLVMDKRSSSAGIEALWSGVSWRSATCCVKSDDAWQSSGRPGHSHAWHVPGAPTATAGQALKRSANYQTSSRGVLDVFACWDPAVVSMAAWFELHFPGFSRHDIIGIFVSPSRSPPSRLAHLNFLFTSQRQSLVLPF